jgi:hypothetical protein
METGDDYHMGFPRLEIKATQYGSERNLRAINLAFRLNKNSTIIQGWKELDFCVLRHRFIEEHVLQVQIKNKLSRLVVQIYEEK